MTKIKKVKKKAPFYTIGGKTVNLTLVDLIKEEIVSLINREENLIFDSKRIVAICSGALTLLYVSGDMLTLNLNILLEEIRCRVEKNRGKIISKRGR